MGTGMGTGMRKPTALAFALIFVSAKQSTCPQSAGRTGGARIRSAPVPASA